ncbi:cell envelope integrity protein CreD [Asticcacaulis sp. AND118]|uniref:cell envelope integrity protein CreD n=1 Tax=Asticcacaulis sp. AND118 TaxID=2840468 RepID=UPI001CFFF3D3|nr:cell envelope integrity protein CreD [Asticcacaulis sp. AND118]UDF03651.1 cell envelope integrity protein CreD [Asticcacaulis sp. AND118]
MDDFPTSTPRPLKGRSKGAKFLVVCALAVLMAIPALLVFALLMERTNRAEGVAREIGDQMGGEQVFLGPVIQIPYVLASRTTTDDKGNRVVLAQETGNLIVFPQTGKASASTKSEVRSRSIFRVPVYTSDLKFDAAFDLKDVQAARPGAVLMWDKAQLITGAADSRGARKDIVAQIDSRSVMLAPSGPGVTGFSPDGTDFDLFAAPLTITDTAAPLNIKVAMTFTGTRKLGILAYGKSSEATITGDWKHPSFGGGFLPVTRETEGATHKGFSAQWSVPFIARGLPAVIDQNQMMSLGKSELSVTFVEPTNPYQSVGRSLKYALLFVGLVFLTYFLFESTSKKELHPAQYILVGLAQITFYLLLLSFAERIGFDAAFLVAAGATVTLIAGYAGLIFHSRWRFVAALGVFSALYALIYVLMRMEDYALLVGACSAFIVIAAVMVLTRNINWYGNRTEAE